MKTIRYYINLSAILFGTALPATLSAQKNYISFEGGVFYGNAESQMNSNMEGSGFGDKLTYISDNSFLNYFPLLGMLFGTGTSVSYEDYPKNTTGHGKFWARYGRELKNKRFLEVSFGKIHNSSVTGFDAFEYQEPIDGNALSYTTNVYAVTAHYIFSTKSKSAGIGAGPALAFNSIERNTYTSTEKKKVIQPGLSSTAYWRFINGDVFFMALRTDAIFFVPATIDAVTLTSPKGNQSTFQSAKVNSFTGDITVSVGLKF